MAQRYRSPYSAPPAHPPSRSGLRSLVVSTGRRRPEADWVDNFVSFPYVLRMTRTVVDLQLRQLAEHQRGVISRAQACALGLSSEAIQRRVVSGAWEPVTPRVLRLTGCPRDYPQACLAAVLDAGDGAVASHLSAAYLWGLPGFVPVEPVEVSRYRRRGRHPSVLATLHEPRLLPKHHRDEVDSVPVTTVARTVFDLAGCLHPQRTERALDNALNRNLVAVPQLRSAAVELLEHGRTGSALMRVLLEDRGVGYVPPESGLEGRFLGLLDQAGIERPDCQVDLGGDAWIGRVDFYYRRLRLVIEIDSDRHHTAKLDREHDVKRDAALRAAGYRVLRIQEQDVRHRPWVVLVKVRAALKDVD